MYVCMAKCLPFIYVFVSIPLVPSGGIRIPERVHPIAGVRIVIRYPGNDAALSKVCESCAVCCTHVNLLG